MASISGIHFVLLQIHYRKLLQFIRSSAFPEELHSDGEVKKKTNMSNFMQMNYNPLVLLSSLQLQCSWTTTKLIHDYHIIDLNTENRWSITQQETSTRLIWPQCKRLFIIMLLWYKWLCKSEKMLFSFPCAGLLIISGAIWCLGLGDQTITPQLMANPLHLSYSRLLWITIWRETATVVGVKWYWT